jgi:hypothetical protein
MARTSGTRKLIKEGMQKLALEGLGAEAGAGVGDVGPGVGAAGGTGVGDVGPGVGAAGGTGYVPIGAGMSYVNDAITETQKTKNSVISELLKLYQRFTVWSLISTSTTST